MSGTIYIYEGLVIVNHCDFSNEDQLLDWLYRNQDRRYSVSFD